MKVSKKLAVPAPIRAFIIGKQGSKISEISNKTFCNIKVPQSQPGDVRPGEYEDDAEIEVTIEGSLAGVNEAIVIIQKIVSERVCCVLNSR